MATGRIDASQPDGRDYLRVRYEEPRPACLRHGVPATESSKVVADATNRSGRDGAIRMSLANYQRGTGTGSVITLTAERL